MPWAAWMKLSASGLQYKRPELLAGLLFYLQKGE
jgi:hypothetical protein